MIPTHVRQTVQICLSKSWGGLEMVALEFAQDFHNTKISVTTICIKDSAHISSRQNYKINKTTHNNLPTLA